MNRNTDSERELPIREMICNSPSKQLNSFLGFLHPFLLISDSKIRVDRSVTSDNALFQLILGALLRQASLSVSVY